MAQLFLSLLAVSAVINHAASLQINTDLIPNIVDLSQVNTITWETVTSDPSTALIQLVNMYTFPLYSLTIAQNVSLADREYTYGPITDVVVPSKIGYSIQFLKAEERDSAIIIAQSGSFEVVHYVEIISFSATSSTALSSATSPVSSSSKTIAAVTSSTTSIAPVTSQPTTEDDPKSTSSQVSVPDTTSTSLPGEPTTSQQSTQSISAQTSAPTPTPSGVLSSGSILGGGMVLSAVIMIVTTIAILL